MKSKGQMTIFIIFGFILLIAIGFIFYIRTISVETGEDVSDIPLEIRPVKNFVDDCLNEVAVPGIYDLAAHGGFIYAYPNTLKTEIDEYVIYLENGQITIPQIDFIENELSVFVEQSLEVCTNNFENFEYLSFDLGEIDAEVKLAKEDINIKVNYPIKIIQQGRNTTISEFFTIIPIRLKHIYNIATDITQQFKDSDYLDTDFLTSFDAEIIISPYDENNFVYSIVDSKSNFDNITMYYNFVITTDFVENKAPSVQEILDQTAYVDELYSLIITTNDPEAQLLTYQDNSALFDITPSGEILFIPTPADIGLYNIEITVTDEETKIIRPFILNITQR